MTTRASAVFARSKTYAGAAAGGRALPLGIVVFIVALAITLELAREAAVSAWDTVWAEDGSVFLQDGLDDPFLRTLAEPYGGYVHVLPRLIAGVAAAASLEHAALVFSVGWAVVVSLSALFVYFAAADVFQSRWTRVALGLLVAFLPAAGSELLGNATNLHFYLTYTCFWALVWSSETRAALAARGVVIAAATLSDPLTVLFGPLVVWRSLVRRTRRAFVIPAVFASGLVVQLVAIVLSEAPQRLSRFDVADVPPLFALRVTGSLLVGDRFIDDLWFLLGRGFAYGALATVAIACCAGAAASGWRTRRFVALCSFYAIAFFAVDLFGRGSAGMRPGHDEATWHLAGARFTYAPILFLSAALLAVADDLPNRFRDAPLRRARPVALALATAMVAANFSFSSERSLGPSWKATLSAARDRCEETGGQTRVPVAPGPFGFALETSCARLALTRPDPPEEAARSVRAGRVPPSVDNHLRGAPREYGSEARGNRRR
jgi:hypothetical protein